MTIGIDCCMHKALRENHLEGEDESVKLEGRTLRDEMAAQRRAVAVEGPRARVKDALMEVPQEVAKEGVLHVVKHGIANSAIASVEYLRDTSLATIAEDAGGALWKGATATVAVPALVVAAGKATIESALKNIREGDELHDSALREVAYGASMELCRDALPEGFRKEFWDKSSADGGATMQVKQSLVDQGAAVHDAFVANIRDGQRGALERGIRAPEDLEGALKTSSDFRDRYEGDVAFRQGVDSAMWAQQHGQLDALFAKLGETAKPAAFQARG
jgi:hypothetical protein